MLPNLLIHSIYSRNILNRIIHPKMCFPCNSFILNTWCIPCSSSGQKFNSKKNPFPRVIHEKSDRFNMTRQRLRRRGKSFLADLKETRHKMKEKMQKIIKRENIYTIPNILCTARILVTPYLGYLILQTDFNTAFCVMVFAGLTDLLDGLIARNVEKQSSNLGSFLDPMADKILVSTMFLTLTYVDLIPVLLTVLIVARDISLAAAGFYIRYKSLPPPRTISRYFDVTHATAQLAPTFISKVNTMVQLCTVAATLSGPVLHFSDHPIFFYLWWFTGFTTVLSGISYIFSKNTYKLLKRGKDKTSLKT